VNIVSRWGAERREWAPALVIALVYMVVPGQAAAATPNRVYVETNNPGGNQVVVFKRTAAGGLREQGRVSTGGVGAPASMQVPIVDSVNSVILSQDKKLLFAVNAGSNTVSSFKLGKRGMPRLVAVTSSQGEFPLSLVSLADRKHGRPAATGILYTVNYKSGDITGFRYAANGKLKAIPGGHVPLSTPGPGARPSEIQIDHRKLFVENRNPNTMDVWKLSPKGAPRARVTTHVADAAPYGMAFLKNGTVLVNGSDSQTESSYRVSASGRLSRINTAGPSGHASCWVSITPNQRFAFTSDVYGFGPSPLTNPPSAPEGQGTLTRFGISRSGRLTYLGNVVTHSGGLADDSALSPNGRQFDVLEGDAKTFRAYIETYRVTDTGELLFVHRTPEILDAFTSGLTES
jgi:6-phosphogluconolactonase (cycloisomerase 2 family)